MLNNPLIRRYRYSLLRPSHFLVYVTIYISVVVLLLFINYTIYKHQDTFSTPKELCKGIYFQFLTFQIIVLWFWGAFSSAAAIKEEITGKTYDFFRMLPLAAHQKTIGILIGKNLVVLLLGVISCLFLIFFGSTGGLSANLQLQIFFALLSIIVLVNSIALLSSINPAQKTKKTNLFALVLLAFFFGPFLMGFLGVLSEIEKLENNIAWFFEIELPLLILVSLIALYFSCWVIKGILRKFTREDEPLFTRKGAFLFLLGFEFILLGLFYNYLQDSKIEREISHVYWTLSLSAILVIPFGALRSFDKYLEYSGLIQRPNINAITRLLAYSNISLGIILFALWSAGTLVANLIGGFKLLEAIYRIWILFTFYVFFLLLLELHVLYKPISRKIGHLLSFIAIVYIVLPLILSTILESDTIYLYSPFGFLSKMFTEPTLCIEAKPVICILNALFCVIPILLIKKRYAHIITLRQKM